VKSRAGRRTIGLPEPLLELLRTHRAEQAAEQAAARQLWRDEGWVFATLLGAPLNHNSDYHEWKRLLETTGLREARLHDARHTAATVLLILGQPERTVMSLMGWSDAGMTRRYQHVTDSMRADVATQVGNLIWDVRSPNATHQTVVVRRSSLAVILPLVEDAVVQGSLGDADLDELQSALTDLRTALFGAHDESRGGAK